MPSQRRFIRLFEEVTAGDVALVGGKTASLGEMYRALRPRGVLVPDGFAITADAYRYVLTQAQAWEKLHTTLDGAKVDDMEDLARRGSWAREIVYSAGIPQDLEDEILGAYRALQHEYGPEMTVAVCSSATAEDLPTASFAGQEESFLNVKGEGALLDACRRCFASLFTDRAIHYRVDVGFDHFKVALSIAVMKMVRADLASSGVIFTLDTESGFRDVVLITGSYGLGENVVRGAVEPDEMMVFKPTLFSGHRAVLRRSLGSKKIKMVYAEGGGREATCGVETPQAEREHFCITDEEAVSLAEQAVEIERHYSARLGAPQPMDIEWAKDGIDQRLYIVQARPVTGVAQKTAATIEEYVLGEEGRLLVSGRAVGERIAAGPVRLIASSAQAGEFRSGDVLVTGSTTPDWEPIMRRAAAIVTNRGGRTCHAAIVAREFGVPAVVGAEDATERLATGQQITVCCSEGDVGKVYEGKLRYEILRTNLTRLTRPRTQIMLIVSNPELAFHQSTLPNDGVGLARMEFIITDHIKAHPMALLHSRPTSMPGFSAAAGSSRGRRIPCSDFAAHRGMHTPHMPKALRWNAQR